MLRSHPTATTSCRQSFAGWTKSGPVQSTTDPAKADAAYPAVLKEYGFADAETVTYTRADGRKLTVKAARFNDATGAYGAFTFYRQPAMGTERIGTKAASANQRILFFRDNVLVDANFDRLTEMSAAELRELAGMLPAAKASAANLPSLPEYLPKSDAVENSAKYILGPQALLAQKGPLTPEQVDFSHDPEILIQDYSSKSGPLTLTVIQYPTPQIAGERLRALQSADAVDSELAARQTQRSVGRCRNGNCRQQRGARASQLRELRSRGHVERSDVDEQARQHRQSDRRVFALIGIILLISLIFGVFFGGIRILMKRLFPNRVFDRPEDVEIIQLHLQISSRAV